MTTLDHHIQIANTQLNSLRALSLAQIQTGLKELYQLVQEQSETIAQSISKEAKKPITLARAEVSRGLESIEDGIFFCSNSDTEMIPLDHRDSSQGRIAWQGRFPLGIIAAITPFNFPFNLVLHKVIPALISKNAVILKPSLFTPGPAKLLEQLVNNTSLPKNCLQVLSCSDEETASLCMHPDIAAISFTGSSKIGTLIQKQSPHKKVLLECGGTAALILEKDANLDIAIPAAIKGAFAYAGQTCISVQHLYIHDTHYEKAKTALVKSCKDISYGELNNEKALLSCLISEEATERVSSTVEAAIQAGAELLCGHHIDSGIYLPTILENVPTEQPLNQEEIFGPVLILERYTTLDSVINRINQSRYGLQHGLFTQDISTIQHVYKHLDVGGLMVNESPTWRVDTMPYGGIKDSGNTKEGISSAVEELSSRKLCVINPI